MDYLLLIIGVLTVYASLMVVFTGERRRRLPYLNAMNFGITALIALSIQHPLTGAVALLYFIFSTLESNSIASTIDRMREE
ncbi:hypothetical protein AKJ65_02660 [candidate division MSBL1 archaeon SCGC-AAA259E19]|uniref:DUF2109 domain-containing protein n=1 Tax=candidate division MSBL1 archaeon SCGC-AAA259E19 TaxID=1698264 RepID=A0A133ULM3_9EURY|nr:hypothetical protein AKJ65_02660 [candidate division MSBL1 archaeon SCGC-AAA259E19]